MIDCNYDSILFFLIF